MLTVGEKDVPKKKSHGASLLDFRGCHKAAQGPSGPLPQGRWIDHGPWQFPPQFLPPSACCGRLNWQKTHRVINPMTRKKLGQPCQILIRAVIARKVPHPRDSVTAGRDQAAAVRAERRRPHDLAVVGRGGDRLTRRGIPHSHIVIGIQSAQFRV